MSQHRRQGGFTLLEILIVVMVVGIAAALVIPESIKAINGSRLRSGLEQITSLNRYARSKALLDTTPMAVLYHGDTRQVQLLQLPPRQELNTGLDSLTPPPRLEEEWDPQETSTDELKELRAIQLPDGISIENVKGAEQEDGTWFILYTAGGMTDPHTVEVHDDEGRPTYIAVEGLTGEVRIYE